MNRKTIKSIINKKFNDWLNSIYDDRIKTLIRNNTIITGGSIVSMLLNEKVKDFDVYFKNREALIAISKYYCDKFNEKNKKNIVSIIDNNDDDNLENDRIKIFIKSKGVASEDDKNILDKPFEDVYDVIDKDDINENNDDNCEDKKQRYRPIFLSSNAITLSNKIQIVVRFYGEPEEIHKNYDFIHCTNYWTSWDNKLELKKEALESILSKQLYYVGSKYPVCSVIRTRKFIKRGWHINAGQYLKMLWQVSELNLKDINVLEDQLIGVDSAYFNMLIESLKNKKDKDQDFSLNCNYLYKIIDRIF